MVENVILGCFLLGLGILVYYTYKRINTIEKEKQAELDKEIGAEWEQLEAEMAMEE